MTTAIATPVRRALRLTLLGALLPLAACTWIELTAAGAAVAQGSPGAVDDCEHVGTVAASTQNRMLLKRSRGKVAEELIVMARNEAATLGGDTVVPTGAMAEGRQNFNVYRCDPDRSAGETP